MLPISSPSFDEHIGEAQQPVGCGVKFTITANNDPNFMFITPGIKNCISCSLQAMGQVTWQVTLPGTLLTVDVGPTTPFAEVEGNFLILAEPEGYVQPGFEGAKQIVCNGGGQQIATFLASPGELTAVHVNISTCIHAVKACALYHSTYLVSRARPKGSGESCESELFYRNAY